MDDTTRRTDWRRWGGAGALVAGGLLAGGLVAGTLSANAADPSSAATGSTAAATSTAPDGGARDESKSQRSDEHLLSGQAASKVRAAALAKYPGATVLRVETDSDGVYEAHLTTANGQRVTVEMGKDYKVTGEEAGGFGHGGPDSPRG